MLNSDAGSNPSENRSVFLSAYVLIYERRRGIHMNSKSLVDKLVEISKEDRTTTQRVMALIFGALFFLAIVPGILVWLGAYVAKYVVIPVSHQSEMIFGLICAAIGIVLVVWTAWVQWKIGEGTPAPISPTRKLVVEGPFKYTRNPTELGAIFYFLGVGSFLVSLTAGIFAMLFPLIFASLYNRFIEEKELLARFEDEYVQYHQQAPFLIPRFWSGFKKLHIRVPRFRRKVKKAEQ
jgi:protein-S-isoprenylcysteine O-methyltransferase Ste14